MRITNLFLAAWLIILGWSECAPFAKVEKRQLMVTADSVNVRSGPGTDWKITDSLGKGTKVGLLNEEGGWYEVRLPGGGIGWIDARFVKEVPYRGFVVTKEANIRVGPGTDCKIMKTVPRGTEIQKLDELGNWYRVRLPNGEIGWIHRDLVGVK